MPHPSGVLGHLDWVIGPMWGWRGLVKICGGWAGEKIEGRAARSTDFWLRRRLQRNAGKTGLLLPSRPSSIY